MKPEAATQTFAITGYTRTRSTSPTAASASSRRGRRSSRTSRGRSRRPRSRDSTARSPSTSTPPAPRPGSPALGARDRHVRPLSPSAHAARLDHQSQRRRSPTFARVGAVRQADITTATGPVVTLTIDAAGTPLSASSKCLQCQSRRCRDHDDVRRLPGRQRAQAAGAHRRKGRRLHDVGTAGDAASSLGGDAGDLAAPASASAPAPPAAAPNVT